MISEYELILFFWDWNNYYLIMIRFKNLILFSKVSMFVCINYMMLQLTVPNLTNIAMSNFLKEMQ